MRSHPHLTHELETLAVFESFTVSGSSLPLLNVGEEGTISRFVSNNIDTIQNLKNLGLDRGTPIQMVERFPNVVVKTGEREIALCNQLSRAVYVRTSFAKRR